MANHQPGFDLLVLSREWMGMGEWDDYINYITSDYGSFPHSLLSTSKLTIKKDKHGDIVGSAARQRSCLAI